MGTVTEAQRVIDVLRRLQAIDDEIRDVRDGRDAMTENFAKLNRVLGMRDGQLVDMRSKLTEAETWHNKKTFELENEREKLQKAKTKLSGVTRSKEYVAVNREMDNIRKNLASREDEVGRWPLRSFAPPFSASTTRSTRCAAWLTRRRAATRRPSTR